MPCYAVLGATGNTGLSLVKVLGQSPDKHINAYCRSRAKLLRLYPEAEKDQNLCVFEGSLKDQATLVECLRGTRAAFLTVAVSTNVPGCTVAVDTAEAVIAALRVLHKDHETLPKLIILSSASLEYQFYKKIPRLVHKMLLAASSNVYKDLERAEAILRDEQSWIGSTTWIKPGALTFDTQKGHIVSKDVCDSPVSFMDLAAGMIQVADDLSGTYHMTSVSVNPASKNVAIPWYAIPALLKGLLFHFFPGTHKYLG